MSDSSHPKRFLSRRRFFKHTAALASLSALPLLRSSKLDEQAVPASTAAGRIALLLPQASMRASAAERFLAGWRSGLSAESGVEVERYTSPHDALVRIERLAGQDDVALVTGFVSYQHAVGLGPALQKLGTPLLVSDVGANVADVTHPFVRRQSLSMWQSSLAMGDWAARNLGRRAVLLVSSYDSGHQAFRALQSGFEHAGGTLDALFVTHSPAIKLSLNDVFDHPATRNADVVLAAYSGTQAAEFLVAYGQSPLAGRTPVAGTAFLADAGVLDAVGVAAEGVYSPYAWLRDDSNPASDPLAMLGYSSATHASQLVEAMRTSGSAAPVASFEQPVSLLIRQVRMLDGQPSHAGAAQAQPIHADDPRLNHICQCVGGWTHAYLSIDS